jgi:hypothetical protein
MITARTIREWPDLVKDQTAWEYAKQELGPKATIHEIAKRAQELKEEMCNEN